MRISSHCLFAALLSASLSAQVGNLQLSTAALSFTAQSGTSLPQTQVFGASSTGAVLPVNVSVRYFSGADSWLSASASTASTPSTVTVTANPTGLAAGTYIGQVLVVASQSQSGLVTVTLTVTGAAPGGNVITASPQSVTLSATSGQLVQSTVTLASIGAESFQVFVNTSSGGNWLSYIAAGTVTPSSLTVLANSTGLAAGTYSGTISVAPLNGQTGTAIPVTLVVGGGGGIGGFTLAPTSLTFLYQTGTANPAAQAVFVNNTSGIVNYTASSSATWLRMSSNTNVFPGQVITGTSNSNLNVFVEPAGLTPGFYTATVNVLASSGDSQSLSVSLTVSGSSLLSANPSSLSFTYNPNAGVPSPQQTSISASGAPLSFTASASSTGWLLVGPQSGATNGLNNLTVSVSPVGLPAGTYTGSIQVTGGQAALNIPVTLTVSSSAANSITASPASLQFQAAPASSSASQSLLLSAPSARNFTALASTTGGAWLAVTPSSGAAPATLTVTVNPLLAGGVGTYTGLITINNVSEGTQLVVPVAMTLSSGGLAASPQTVSFTLNSGAQTGATQNVQLSGGVGTAFAAVSDSSWLAVTPNTGSLPTVATLAVSAANLAPGNYSGTVTVSSGQASVILSVQLTATSPAGLAIAPTFLAFQHTPGRGTPSPQTLSVSSSSVGTAFSAVARTGADGEWLRVAPLSGATTGSVTVSVDPAGLAAGTYRGTVTVSATATGETRVAEVTLAVTGPAAPVLRTALHGAMRQLSAITPGMILSLEGIGLGPAGGAGGTVTAAGAFETSLQGYRALFDGVPAPILFANEGHMDVVVPYAVAGRASTRVVAALAGTESNALELRLSPDASPGIFSFDASGRGQAAALNENGTVNGPSNPASAGGVLVFYATGEGQTRPAGQDGRVIATDLRVPLLPVAVNVGGEPAEVLYAGSAPDQVSGLMQVNVRLPATVARGTAVSLELRVGPAPSQPGITIAIR
jgi:uncharacterized protein (TIGR03437 family)